MSIRSKLSDQATKSYALRRAIEERYQIRHSVRDEVLFELASSYMEEAGWTQENDIEWEDREEFQKFILEKSFIWDAVDQIVEAANAAMARYPDDGCSTDRWNYRALAKLDNKKESDDSGRLDELTLCARSYIASPWARSIELELWLARHMIFAETFAFGREVNLPFRINSKRYWWEWAKSTVKWGIGVLVAWEIGAADGAAIGVAVYVFWLCAVRFLVNDRVASLSKLEHAFALMRHCYVLSLRPQPSPAELTDALRRAEDVLAVWPDGLRMLVQTASARNNAVWR